MRLHQSFIGLLVIAGALLYGCSSSKDSKKEEQAPPAQDANLPKASEKVDRVTVDKQTTPAPQYEPSATGIPGGKFSVQIGAYSISQNADRIVALAKERFPRNVYVFQDKEDKLYKVRVGDFQTRD